MRIGIDCDLTTIASDEAWYLWLQSVCGGEHEHTPWSYFKEKIIKEEGVIDYNLSTFFPEPKNDNIDAFSFWKGDSTYDTVKTVQGAISSITELSKKHEIVFISALKGHHHRSKYNWLKRHFDFQFAFVGTKEKYICNVACMIDDRLDILNKFDEDVLRIWYNTPYTQKEAPKPDLKMAIDWDQVVNIIEEEGEVKEDNLARVSHGIVQ